MTESLTWEFVRPAIKGDVAEVEALALSAATEISFNAVSHLVVVADMSSATWGSTGTHEVFTVTGAVRLRLWAICTSTLTDAADLAEIRLGTESDVNGWIAATGAAGKGGVALTAGGFWCSTAGTVAHGAASAVVLDKVIGGGLDVGYRITGENLTGGTLEFHCVWEKLAADGNVVAGAGGAL